MIWRISRNGQLKTKCTSIPRRPKHYLLREKGYNISFAWKQKAYNYTLTPQNINQILHHKLLGLIIDKDLSFEAYIQMNYVQETVKTSWSFEAH